MRDPFIEYSRYWNDSCFCGIVSCNYPNFLFGRRYHAHLKNFAEWVELIYSDWIGRVMYVLSLKM